jgi:SAM-dependent methyltransferase
MHSNLFARPSTASAYADYRPSYPPVLFQFLKDNVDALRTAPFDAQTNEDKHIFFGFDVKSLLASNELSSTGSGLNVVDMGCGSGQATKGLVDPPLNAAKVLAVDISPAQIASATPLPNVTFSVGGVHEIQSLIKEHDIQPVDLVTVAQAFHWFHFDKDIATLHELLLSQPRPALLAAWGYDNPILANDEANALVNSWLYQSVFDRFWSSRRVHVNDWYEAIQHTFPADQWHTARVVCPASNPAIDVQALRERVRVDEGDAPPPQVAARPSPSASGAGGVRVGDKVVYLDSEAMYIKRSPTVSQFVGYLSSWSAYATWRHAHEDQELEDPVEAVRAGLVKIYGSEDAHIELKYPIFILLAVAKERKA